MCVDPEDRAIVSAIINMSRSLGCGTLAEGVESAEQLALLRELGCDQVQGYLYAQPMTASAFENYYRNALTLPAAQVIQIGSHRGASSPG